MIGVWHMLSGGDRTAYPIQDFVRDWRALSETDRSELIAEWRASLVSEWTAAMGYGRSEP